MIIFQKLGHILDNKNFTIQAFLLPEYGNDYHRMTPDTGKLG